MLNIYSDFHKINNTDGKLYLGNKLLHIFFLINLASKFNLKLKIPKNSNFDNLLFLIENKNYFNYEEFKKIKLGFKEESVFSKYNSESLLTFYLNNLIDFFKNKESIKSELKDKSFKQFQNAKIFSEKLLLNDDFYVSGNFWHYDLMPSQNTILNYITLNKDIINKIKKKFPDIESNNTVAIHFRGRDFNNHLRTYFKNGIKLERKYFEKAINIFTQKFGKDYKFYLFSDENETLSEYLTDFNLEKIVVTNQSAVEDWISIMLCKNIIQSNSSFCWTASLFNKQISIQPKNGYGHNDNFGPIPYGFYMKNSIIL